MTFSELFLKEIGIYNSILNSGGFVTLPDNLQFCRLQCSDSVALLRERLEQENCLVHPHSSDIYDEVLMTSVMIYQEKNCLSLTGYLNESTIKSMNISCEDKIRQLKASYSLWKNLPNRFSNVVTNQTYTLDNNGIVVKTEPGLDSSRFFLYCWIEELGYLRFYHSFLTNHI